MLIHKDKQKELIKELHIRYNELICALEGEQATEDDRYHGLTNATKRWPPAYLYSSYKIKDSSLRIALADFKTILSEIARLK